MSLPRSALRPLPVAFGPASRAPPVLPARVIVGPPGQQRLLLPYPPCAVRVTAQTHPPPAETTRSLTASCDNGHSALYSFWTSWTQEGPPRRAHRSCSVNVCGTHAARWLSGSLRCYDPWSPAPCRSLWGQKPLVSGSPGSLAGTSPLACLGSCTLPPWHSESQLTRSSSPSRPLRNEPEPTVNGTADHQRAVAVLPEGRGSVTVFPCPWETLGQTHFNDEANVLKCGFVLIRFSGDLSCGPHSPTELPRL